MKKEPCRLSISRVTCARDKGYILIRVCKEDHTCIVDVEVPLEGFAEAITGLGYIKCEATVYDKPKGDDSDLKGSF